MQEASWFSASLETEQALMNEFINTYLRFLRGFQNLKNP